MIIGISGKIGSGKDTIGRIIQSLTSKSPIIEYVIKESGIEHLLNTYNYNVNSKNELDIFNWKIKKFAGKLKQIVSILTGIPVEDLEKQEVKDRVLGEEWDRYLLKEHWINDEYAEHEQFTYFASNEDMQKYINDMGHTDSTCSRVGKVKLTVRQLLQLCGTEAMRNAIHPNVWVNALFADYIDKVPSGNLQETKYWLQNNTTSNWIITDVRFPNELKAVKNKGGISIRVNRLIDKRVYIIANEQPFENWYGIVESYNGNNFYNVINNVDDVVLVHKNQIMLIDEHISETALDNATFDYVIDNNSDIQSLIKKVKIILEKENIL